MVEDTKMAEDTNKTQPFPGELGPKERQQIVEKEQQVQAEEDLRQKGDNYRKGLIRRFLPVPKPSRGAWIVLCYVLLTLDFGVFGLDREARDFEVDPQGHVVRKGPSVRKAVHEWYNPFYDAGTDSYRKTVNHRFKEHAPILGVAAFGLAFIFIGLKRKEASVAKGVDAMLGFGSSLETGEQSEAPVKIDDEALGRVVSVDPDIVQGIAGENEVFFKAVLSGYFNCQNNRKIYDFVCNILRGHLYEHPEDWDLVIETFGKNLPYELMQDYVRYYKALRTYMDRPSR